VTAAKPPSAAAAPPPPASQKKRAKPVDAGAELNRIKADWAQIAARLSRRDAQAGRYLADSRPLKVSARHVEIGVDPEFAGERQRFENPHVHTLLNRMLSDLLDRSVEVRVRVQAAEPKDPPPDRDLREWVQDPAVNRVLETFSGRVLEVR
jgi:hypothetical protein